MNNRTLMWMTGLVVLSMLVLLFLNVAPYILSEKVEKYINYNDVRGMAVEHKKKLYTLNFDQQVAVLGYLNKAVPISESEISQKPKLEISKIIIYRFGVPDLTITPIDYQDNDLVFSSPDWNEKGLLKDVSRGALKNLLSQTYDP